MEYLDAVAVVVIGALVAVGELVSRYRDAPYQAVGTRPAAVYVGVNALAAAFALFAARIFGWRFGVSGGDEAIRLTQVLTTGFGCMALFRSSLFRVRAGDQDVGIGPIAFLQVILAAADREVDRLRAQSRAVDVTEVMEGLSFVRAHEALPACCFSLMQNVDATDQVQVGEQIKVLAASEMNQRAKVLVLCLYLMNIVGDEVLRRAITALGLEIRAADSLRLPPAKVRVGQMMQLRAEPCDTKGRLLPGRPVTWSGSDVGVASISATGLLTGVSMGTATVTAAVEEVSAAATVTVE